MHTGFSLIQTTGGGEERPQAIVSSERKLTSCSTTTKGRWETLITLPYVMTPVQSCHVLYHWRDWWSVSPLINSHFNFRLKMIANWFKSVLLSTLIFHSSALPFLSGKLITISPLTRWTGSLLIVSLCSMKHIVSVSDSKAFHYSCNCSFVCWEL